MGKLITAEQAREMQSTNMNHFLNIGIEKYIKYINERIREATRKGMSRVDLGCTYHPITPYAQAPLDLVMSELSEPQMKQIINLLEENGYMVYLASRRDNMTLSVLWDKQEEPPESPRTKILEY
jgi:hypothetical protein